MPRNPGGTVSGFKLLSTPDAPAITNVVPDIGSVSVFFTAPTDTGDAAITSYVVTTVNESTGASAGTTGTSSPISVSLASGTFKIRMQALNAYGPGRLTEYDTGNSPYSGTSLSGWGLNTSREIGDGTGTTRSSPVQVGSSTWSKISAGGTHSSAIRPDGTLWTWGAGGQGRLGISSSPAYVSSPTQVGALTKWATVSAGNSGTSATTTTNQLYSWGNNSNGELGDNTLVDKSSPIQVGALTNWAQVSVGNSFRVSVKTNGTLWSWGLNNYGQLGSNSRTNRSSPVQLGALTNWSSVSAGSGTVISVKTDGTLWAWGRNDRGQLGGNAIGSRSSPVQVGALTNWLSSSTGEYHVAAIKTDNTLWTWGRNTAGQLGDNATNNRSSPTQVGTLSNWSEVAAGSNFALPSKRIRLFGLGELIFTAKLETIPASTVLAPFKLVGFLLFGIMYLAILTASSPSPSTE